MTQVRGAEESRRGELLRRADAFQRRHDFHAYLYAVIRKFADDGSRQDAALVAYYSFFALLPLLLVVVSVLGLLLRSNVDLQARVLDSGFAQFPIIGDQLRRDVSSLDRTGLGLVVGFVLVVIGARGLTLALQRAADAVWGALPALAPRSGLSVHRTYAVAVMAVIGGGLLATSVVTGIVVSGLNTGPAIPVAGVAIVIVLNAGLLVTAFWLSTGGRLPAAELWPAAIPAAVVWTALQTAGALLVDHQVSGATEVGGFFAIVIGLMIWLYLGSLATVYAMQAQVVRFQRLWPRPLGGGVPTQPEPDGEADALHWS
jgi:membrane protein